VKQAKRPFIGRKLRCRNTCPHTCVGIGPCNIAVRQQRLAFARLAAMVAATANMRAFGTCWALAVNRPSSGA